VRVEVWLSTACIGEVGELGTMRRSVDGRITVRCRHVLAGRREIEWGGGIRVRWGVAITETPRHLMEPRLGSRNGWEGFGWEEPELAMESRLLCWSEESVEVVLATWGRCWPLFHRKVRLKTVVAQGIGKRDRKTKNRKSRTSRLRKQTCPEEALFFASIRQSRLW